MGASRIARSFPRFSATCWAWEGLPLNPRQGPEGGRGEQASAFEAACGLGVRPLRAPRNPGQTSPPPPPTGFGCSVGVKETSPPLGAVQSWIYGCVVSGGNDVSPGEPATPVGPRGG